MRGSLVKDDLNVLRVALLKLLLQEATTVLVLAQTVNFVTGHSLQVVVHVLVCIVLQTTALDDASLAVLHTTTWSVSGVWVVLWLSATVHAVGAISRRSTVLRSGASSSSKIETVHSTVEHVHTISIVSWVGGLNTRVL